MGKEDAAAEEDVGATRDEKLSAIDEGRVKPLTTKLINELVVVDLAFVFAQHYAPISAAFSIHQSQDPRRATTHSPTNPGPPTTPQPHADLKPTQ